MVMTLLLQGVSYDNFYSLQGVSHGDGYMCLDTATNQDVREVQIKLRDDQDSFSASNLRLFACGKNLHSQYYMNLALKSIKFSVTYIQFTYVSVKSMYLKMLYTYLTLNLFVQNV